MAEEIQPTTSEEIRLAIVHEIYIALERLGASPELLGAVGSWGDTLSDQDALDSLRFHNRTGFTELISKAER